MIILSVDCDNSYLKVTGNNSSTGTVLLDAPWSVHVPNIGLWVIVEVQLVTIGVIVGQELRRKIKEARVSSATLVNDIFVQMCDINTRSRVSEYNHHY